MGIHKETLDKKFFFFTRVDPIVIFFFLNPNLYYNIRFFIIILFFTSFERGRKCLPGNFEKKKISTKWNARFPVMFFIF
jgi:hypothetical protein